jgi:membrane-bound metal-dependent hydrolase YbcI (DUF457 family)
MDNVTHTFVGVHLARAGSWSGAAKRALIVLVVASNLPDVDGVLLLVGGPLGFLGRRTLTHSLPGIAVTAGLAAFLFRLRFRESSWRSLFGLCILGLGVHILLDLVNSYGVALLYPFSHRRTEFACVFIVDPWIWGILLVPFLASLLWRAPRARRALARGSLAGLALYVFTCWGARGYAAGMLDRAARAEGKAPDYAYVFPEVLGPQRFRGVLRYGDEYRVYLVPVFRGKAELRATYETAADTPDVRLIRQTRSARRLERFYAAPVWKRDGGHAYEVFDLRFRSVLEGWTRTPFAFRFEVRGGRVEGPIPIHIFGQGAQAPAPETGSR